MTHTGQVELANQSTGEWRLLTQRGPIKSKIFPDGPKLDGLQIGQRYRFQCAEVPDPDSLSRNQTVLYLRLIETASAVENDHNSQVTEHPPQTAKHARESCPAESVEP